VSAVEPLRIVVKMGGSVCRDPAQVGAVAGELRALQDAGHAAVVVHGGGPQLDEALQALGEPVRKVDGLRATSPAAAAVVARVMDEIGAELARQLAAHGIGARHLGAGQGAFPATVKDPHLGRVGTVARFAPPHGLPGILPVVTPVGHDADGPLNVNADEGAAAVAAWWRAHWLVLATDVAAVRGAAGEPLARLLPQEAQRLIGGAAQGGMIPKLGNAVQALRGGVERVLIARIAPGALARAILHGDVQGTLVTERP
jgi:acetylglutamate kinase